MKLWCRDCKLEFMACNIKRRRTQSETQKKLILLLATDGFFSPPPSLLHGAAICVCTDRSRDTMLRRSVLNAPPPRQRPGLN